jgi:hypothetical protein
MLLDFVFSVAADGAAAHTSATRTWVMVLLLLLLLLYFRILLLTSSPAALTMGSRPFLLALRISCAALALVPAGAVTTSLQHNSAATYNSTSTAAVVSKGLGGEQVDRN